MLAVSSLKSTRDNEKKEEMESFTIGVDEFADLSEENLLESINFDDLFDSINGDILPDLEMDLDVFTEYSSVSVANNCKSDDGILLVTNSKNKKKGDDGDGDDKGGASDSGTNSGISSQGEEIVSKRDETNKVVDPSKKGGEKGRKSSAQSKNPQGKRKAKVDWTPELHRRFVQAVEQLGVDKAVPSRILEIMGIHGLTRHNIASHLQKYRSHRKHLLAREVEAASWSQRKQLFGSVGAGGGGKREVSPWIAQTIGFPPMTPTHHFRPLHVWGHPKLDHSFVNMWPKLHLQQSPSPLVPPIVPSPHAPNGPSYWHQRAPNALTQGTPCFPQPLTTKKFGNPTVPVNPPRPLAMYKVSSPRQQGPRPFIEYHPSTESVDATIGDVLSKPWLPLPLGLKAPAVDSVMDELQRQGVSKIPSFCA